VLLPDQGDGRDATSLLTGVMTPPYFPIQPTDLRGTWAFATIAPGPLEIEGFQLLAREIPHKGGRTFGYRISDGHSTLTYMPDHSPTTLGPGEDGYGEYHPAALELAKDTDGHSVADYPVGLGARAGARSVALFHHRQNRTDEALDGLAQRLERDSLRVIVASEGTVLEL
jgi:hypothetical protein